MSPELFIRGAKRFDTGEIVDLSIRDGVIAAIGQLTPPQGIEVIEAAGLLVSPGFVDAHVHLDKTRSLGDVESPTLAEAIENCSKFYQAIPPHEIKENIKARAKTTVREAVKAGTTTLRSHVNIEGDEALLSVEAVDELRRELADYVDIKISCLPTCMVMML